MTAAIIAADYGAARAAARAANLGNDWMHVHDEKQLKNMTFSRLILVPGWIAGGATLELYNAAAIRLAPGAIITGGGSARRQSPSPTVEFTTHDENYTPRHAARDPRHTAKLAGGFILGSLTGAAVVGIAVFLGVLPC